MQAAMRSHGSRCAHACHTVTASETCPLQRCNTVHDIVDKAVKEMSMEKVLKELDVTWSTMEFEHDKHPRTQITMLRASEEAIETLEDNQVIHSNHITLTLLVNSVLYVLQFHSG